MVALLRAINVGGNRKVPMAVLAQVARGLGLDDVSTYVQSGNLIFATRQGPEEVRNLLGGACAEAFGFEVDLVVRTAAQWQADRQACPFPDAAQERPQLLHVGFAPEGVAAAAAGELELRCGPGERVAVVGDALWIDYNAGVGRSKLTPQALSKAARSPVTARNWRTVLALSERLG